jgi:hypothetical protein
MEAGQHFELGVGEAAFSHGLLLITDSCLFRKE